MTQPPGENSTTRQIPNRPSASRRRSLTEDQRRDHGTAFSLADREGVEIYHRVRPGYSSEMLAFIADGLKNPTRAVDIGAGTGLFTDTLVADADHETGRWTSLTAVEPSEVMASFLAERHPDVNVVVSSIEDLANEQEPAGLEEGTIDLAVIAQAWHWLDPDITVNLLTRWLRPPAPGATSDTGGRLAIVHHQLDTSIPWVHRLTRIMHAGDVHPVEQAPDMPRGAVFAAPVGHWWRWNDSLTPSQLHDLMMTRSFYLRTTDAQRHRMHSNLDWYLHDHLGYEPDDVIHVPYVATAWKFLPVAGQQA